jgi:hypothetical protein
MKVRNKILSFNKKNVVEFNKIYIKEEKII